MIYIIGGCAKAGKTFIAKKIVKEKSIGFFSTDYLMISLSKSNQNLDIDIHEDDFIVAKKLEPFLEPMIESMIYNKIDYVIEGVHVLPRFIKRMIDKYPNDLTCCFIGFTDIRVEEKVEQLNNHKKLLENCWYSHYSSSQMRELVEYLKKYSQIIKEECLTYDLPYFEIQQILEDSNRIVDSLFINK